MIGNNRHSDRTFVSEHICIRLALFAVRACSLSPSLSPSLFLLPFLPSLSPILPLSLSLAVRSVLLASRSPVSLVRFSRPAFSFESSLRFYPPKPPSLARTPSHLFPPPTTSFLVPPLVTSLLSLLFVPPFHPASLFPRAGPRSFFIPLPGRSLAPSPSLRSPLPFRRCLYIATGWYAGAYIIGRQRVRACVRARSRAPGRARRADLPPIRVYNSAARVLLWRPSWECTRG